MQQRRRSFALGLVFVIAGAERVWAEPLTEALLRLRRQGLNLVFSSRVVTPQMEVVTAPVAAAPRAMLDELLQPHGLAVREGPAGVLIVVQRRRAPERQALPHVSEEIVVQPSRISLLVDEPSAALTLSREQIMSLPHLGDDALRTLHLMPGTASGDASAQVHIRGSRRDELLIVFDGQELYDPYHLKDFDNALGVVGASSLESAHLLTGALPASYGDRNGGVLNLLGAGVPARRALSVEASFLGVRVSAGGRASSGRLGWHLSARRGSTDLLGRIFDVENPRFWDIFARMEYEITPQQTVRVQALVTDDKLDFAGQEDKRLDTEYIGSYVWLTHRVLLGTRGFVDTIVSRTLLEHDRHGFEQDEERTFTVTDERQFDVTALRHGWSVQTGERHFLTAGGEYRRFDGRYDYTSFRRFAPGLPLFRSDTREGELSTVLRPQRTHLALYASDHFRPAPSAGLEMGLRYDRGAPVAPRLAAAVGIGDASVIRLAWGRTSQTHRPNELMIEDGDTRVYEPERSEQWVAGFERFLRWGSIRGEVYRRRVQNPRPRYESLFKTFDPFPEGEIDRVRVEAERSDARGVELSLRGARRRTDWWFNYAWATSTDRIAGRDVPRRFEQKHAVNADVHARFPRRWSVNTAVLYHTGWPGTPVEVRDRTAVAGARNSRRLPDYWRVDLRVSRDWRRPNSVVSFFVDAQNAFGRENVIGVDLALENGALGVVDERGPGFVASAGVIWSLP